MVETEESAQAVAPLHVGGNTPRQRPLPQKPVVESLMVSLVVVVLDVLSRLQLTIAAPAHPYRLGRSVRQLQLQPLHIRVRDGVERTQCLTQSHSPHAARAEPTYWRGSPRRHTRRHRAGANTSSMLSAVIDPRFNARMDGSMVFRSPTITIVRWSGPMYCCATRWTSPELTA